MNNGEQKHTKDISAEEIPFWKIYSSKELQKLPKFEKIFPPINEIITLTTTEQEKTIIKQIYDWLISPYDKSVFGQISYILQDYQQLFTKITQKYPQLKEFFDKDNFEKEATFDYLSPDSSTFENINYNITVNKIKKTFQTKILTALQQEFEGNKDLKVFSNPIFYQKSFCDKDIEEKKYINKIFEVLSTNKFSSKEDTVFSCANAKLLETLLFPKDSQEFLSMAFLDKIAEIFPQAQEYIEKLKDVRKYYKKDTFLQTLYERKISLHQGIQTLEFEQGIRENFLNWLENRDKNLFLSFKQNLTFCEYNSMTGIRQFSTLPNKGTTTRTTSIKRLLEKFSPIIDEFCKENNFPYAQWEIIATDDREDINIIEMPERIIKYREDNHPYLKIPYQDLNNYFSELKNIHLSGDLGMGKDILLAAFLSNFKKKYPNLPIRSMDATRLQNSFKTVASKASSENKSEEIGKFLEQFDGTKLFIIENIHNITGKRTQKVLIDLIKSNNAQLIGISEQNIRDMPRSKDGKTTTSLGNILNPQLVKIPFPSDPSCRASQFDEWRNAKFIELPKECQNFPPSLFEGIKQFIIDAKTPTEKYETLVNAVISDFKRYVYEEKEMDLGATIFDTLAFQLGEKPLPQTESIINIVISALNNPDIRNDYLKEEYQNNRNPINKEDIMQKKIEKNSPAHITLAFIVHFFKEYYVNTGKMTRKNIAEKLNKKDILAYLAPRGFFTTKRDFNALEKKLHQDILSETHKYYGIE